MMHINYISQIDDINAIFDKKKKTIIISKL